MRRNQARTERNKVRGWFIFGLIDGRIRYCRLYNRWANMRRKCSNPKHADFEYYGARGITVCSEWQTYATFRKWAVTHGFRKHLTIDRIDNSKGYHPENCRFTTQLVQCANKRDNTFLEFGGERLIISEWARRIGLVRTVIPKRLKRGWSVERTLTTPNLRQTK